MARVLINRTHINGVNINNTKLIFTQLVLRKGQAWLY